MLALKCTWLTGVLCRSYRDIGMTCSLTMGKRALEIDLRSG